MNTEFFGKSFTWETKEVGQQH